MHEKRQILLDRGSLIEHLKNNGHEEDLLLGMSDKQLFELYSMEESDLVNYHVSDATTDEYTIGLGDDIELDEVATTSLYNMSNKDDVMALAQDIGAVEDPGKVSGGQVTIKTSESKKYDKKTLEEKFSKLAKVKELETDKKMVIEMLEKQSRPTATKGKIIEYILNKTK